MINIISSLGNKCTHILQNREPYTSWKAYIHRVALQNNQATATQQNNKNMYKTTHKTEFRYHKKGVISVSWKPWCVKYSEEPIEAAPITIERVLLPTHQKLHIQSGGIIHQNTYMCSLKEIQILC